MKISYTSQTVFTQFLFFLLLIPSPAFLPSPFPVKFIASPIIIIEIDRQTDRAACCPYVPVFRVDGADLRNLGSCCPLLRSSHWWPAALHRCVGHYEFPLYVLACWSVCSCVDPVLVTVLLRREFLIFHSHPSPLVPTIFSPPVSCFLSLRCRGRSPSWG